MKSQSTTSASPSGHVHQIPHIKPVATALLILLWIYAALSKLLDYAAFQGQLANQNIPHALAGILAWALPLTELITCGLIFFGRSRLLGLLLSLVLLSVFTAYIALVLLGAWDRIPCSCGGILSHMSWEVHLGFNLFFLTLTAWTIRYSG